MEYDGDNCTYHDRFFWYSNLRIIKKTGGLGVWRTSGDHPNGQYTEKSPGLEDTCCISVSSERPSAKTNVKNSQRVNNNDNCNCKTQIIVL